MSGAFDEKMTGGGGGRRSGGWRRIQREDTETVEKNQQEEEDEYLDPNQQRDFRGVDGDFVSEIQHSDFCVVWD